MEYQQMNMSDDIENNPLNEDKNVGDQKKDTNIELSNITTSSEKGPDDDYIDRQADKLGSYSMAMLGIESKTENKIPPTPVSNDSSQREQLDSDFAITPERAKELDSLQHKLNAICYLEASETFDPKDPFHYREVRRKRPDDYEVAAYDELEKLFINEMDSYQRYMYEINKIKPEERFKLNHLKVNFVNRYFSQRGSDQSEEHRQKLKEEAIEKNVTFQDEIGKLSK